jgi:integrase
VEDRARRILSVNDVVGPYLEGYSRNHRHKSSLFAKGRLKHVQRLMGSVLLPDLTEDRIGQYIGARLDEHVSGRTINMELGELSRAMKERWSVLWPRVRKLEERKDVGRALSEEEQDRLVLALDRCKAPLIGVIVRVALLTGMRIGEILSLSWGQVDFHRGVVTVGQAKTAAGTGREIPMNTELLAVLTGHAAWFAAQFGESRPEHYLFPFGTPLPSDPTRPVTDIKRAWGTLRKLAGVSCRFHDLRHTVATRMAEAGAPETTMLALMGHMSRAMLERYSHIRMAAKRTAVEALTLTSRGTEQAVHNPARVQ